MRSTSPTLPRRCSPRRSTLTESRRRPWSQSGSVSRLLAWCGGTMLPRSGRSGSATWLAGPVRRRWKPSLSRCVPRSTCRPRRLPELPGGGPDALEAFEVSRMKPSRGAAGVVLIVADQGQRDGEQGQAGHEEGGPVDGIQRPGQLACPCGRAFLFAQERHMRCVLLKAGADGSLDLNIEVGHHLPVALGHGADRLVMTGHLGGGVHGTGGGGQQRAGVASHSGLLVDYSDENTVSKAGNRPRSGHRRCSTNVGESTPR